MNKLAKLFGDIELKQYFTDNDLDRFVHSEVNR